MPGVRGLGECIGTRHGDASLSALLDGITSCLAAARARRYCVESPGPLMSGRHGTRISCLRAARCHSMPLNHACACTAAAPLAPLCTCATSSRYITTAIVHSRYHSRRCHRPRVRRAPASSQRYRSDQHCRQTTTTTRRSSACWPHDALPNAAPVACPTAPPQTFSLVDSACSPTATAVLHSRSRSMTHAHNDYC